MAEMCLAVMTGREEWKLNHRKIHLSNFITIADEALALVVLENNLAEWTAQITNNETSPPKKRRKTKYTGNGVREDGTKKGWSLEGKRRFNDIYDNVEKARAMAMSKDMEEKLMKEWDDEWKKSDKKEKERSNSNEELNEQRMREEEEFVPRNGFDNN